MKHAFAVLLTFAAVAFQIAASASAWASEERWAAIVGLSDRSAVGWSTNQGNEYDAIDRAKIYCRRHAESARSPATIPCAACGKARVAEP